MTELTGKVADIEVDMAVVGLGMSGIAAALAAAEQGASVAGIEQGAVTGGSARLARGLVWAVQDMEEFRRLDPEADLQLLAEVAASLPDDVAWINAYGFTTGPRMDGLYGMGYGYRVTGNLPDTFASLEQSLRDAGGHVLTGYRLDDLQRTGHEGGKEPAWVLVGEAETGERFSLKARTVVLATGSYAASRQRLQSYLGDAAGHMQLRAGANSLGRSLDLAERLDLATTGRFDRFYGHLMPYGFQARESDYAPITLNISEFGLLFGRDGRRFTDESRGDWFNAEAVALQSGGLAYLMLDARRAEASRTIPRYPGAPTVDTIANLRARGISVAQADTLEALLAQLTELAEPLGGPPLRAVASSIIEYNRLLEASPVRAGLGPVGTPPYFGLVVVPGITFGKGGLRVDEGLRVLGTSGDAVAGLYAAGVDIGGIYAHAYAGGLAPALVTGRRAGQEAAAYSVGAYSAVKVVGR
jgi:succinate dehydrogenase/fumarate reductase flavoprotein subunit